MHGFAIGHWGWFHPSNCYALGSNISSPCHLSFRRQGLVKRHAVLLHGAWACTSCLHDRKLNPPSQPASTPGLAQTLARRSCRHQAACMTVQRRTAAWAAACRTLPACLQTSPGSGGPCLHNGLEARQRPSSAAHTAAVPPGSARGVDRWAVWAPVAEGTLSWHWGLVRSGAAPAPEVERMSGWCGVGPHSCSCLLEVAPAAPVSWGECCPAAHTGGA